MSDTERTNLIGTAAIVGATILTAVGGSMTGDFRSPWYRALRKPPWQPQGRVIGAVWTMLYTLISVSGSLLWRDRDDPRVRQVAPLFGAQYLLNAAFTPLFTKAHSLTLATADSALLHLTVLTLVARLWRASRLAAVLLVPYALWTGFATFLIWRVRQLNASRS